MVHLLARCLACGMFMSVLLPPALAQAVAKPSLATASPSAAIIPVKPEEPKASDHEAFLRGLNEGITFSSYHDSISGWATLTVPAVSYTFNDTFSVDASIPIYNYRLAQSLSTNPRPNARLVVLRAELGDPTFALHALFMPRLFNYVSTVSFTAPVGDEVYGLTAGRVTFDVNNEFSRNYRRVTPTLAIGIGDSATLVNRQINKTYTSLGPLAHFELGATANIFRQVTFSSVVYEQLPIGDQKVYSAYRKGRPTVVIGFNVTEDNGFINSLDIPLTRHMTLSGYYNRSLRRQVDDAGVSVTFILRGPPKDKEELAFDELLR